MHRSSARWDHVAPCWDHRQTPCVVVDQTRCSWYRAIACPLRGRSNDLHDGSWSCPSAQDWASFGCLELTDCSGGTLAAWGHYWVLPLDATGDHMHSGQHTQLNPIQIEVLYSFPQLVQLLLSPPVTCARIQRLKRLKTATGTSINDVACTALAAAMGEYHQNPPVAAQDGPPSSSRAPAAASPPAPVKEQLMCMPVNIRVISGPLRLSNEFALTFFKLPVRMCDGNECGVSKRWGLMKGWCRPIRAAPFPLPWCRSRQVHRHIRMPATAPQPTQIARCT